MSIAESLKNLSTSIIGKAVSALDDFKSDMDKGLYNPILQAFKCGKILRDDIFNFVIFSTTKI